MNNTQITLPMHQEEVNHIIYEAHQWFCNHPLGTTDEGYDHFAEFMQTLLEPFSTGHYRNYN